MRIQFFTAVAAAALVAVPASAQTSTGYGSASYSTVRSCADTASTVPCDGRGTGQQTRQTATAGGPSQQVDSSFASSGAVAGGSTTGSVTFGSFGLPTLRATATSSGTNRIGNNIFAYQTFRYDGEDEVDIALLGNLHIVDSSGNASNGALPGGALVSAHLSIWDIGNFPVFTSAQQIINNQYYFTPGCDPDSDDGPRTYGFASATLTGGETNIAVRDQSCYGEETVTLHKGDEFVISAYFGMFANRGGFIDASQSFTVALDPAIGSQNLAALQNNLSFTSPTAMPEPATWAILMLGFGAIGGMLRRRNARPAVATA